MAASDGDVPSAKLRIVQAIGDSDKAVAMKLPELAPLTATVFFNRAGEISEAPELRG